MTIIKIANEHITLYLSSRGASIYRLLFFHVDMVLTTKEEKDFMRSDIYYGKTIGRVAGRELVNDDVILHGGSNGLSNLDFNYLVDGNKVTFTHDDKEMRVSVIYELVNDSLMVNYIVNTKKELKVSLTNHSYFCLGDKDISNLELRMKSHKHIVYDERLIPNRVTSDGYDFNEFKKCISYGDIDNYFYLDEPNIELRNDKYLLVITSNFQGTQIFTDHFLDDAITLLSDKSKYRALAVEPEDDQLNVTVVHPSDTYKKFIKYTFVAL